MSMRIPSTPRRDLPAYYRQQMRPRGERVRAATVIPLPPPLRAKAGLETYSAPLSRRQATHLLRRASFGARIEDVNTLAGMPADEAVALLISEAQAAPLPDPPEWAEEYPPWDEPRPVQREYADKQVGWAEEYAGLWVGEMLGGGLRERLALFWHDHFATERKTYFFTIMAHQYITLIRQNALGNFRDFTLSMSLNPAMLVYLDGNENTVNDPNENYARELLELFTMGETDGEGEPNYSQEDIIELSRCLTGWFVDYDTFTSKIDHTKVDAGEKMVLGRHGRFGYGEVNTVIFEERSRQIAEFVARKLYREFVYITPQEAIVQEMADVFLENDFDIASMVQTLLQSAHFFDESSFGARIKSPAELLVGMLKDVSQGPLDEDALRRVRFRMDGIGQSLLDPPDVAGWTGYRSWITTSLLPLRWTRVRNMVLGNVEGVQINVVPLARELLDVNDPLAAFKIGPLLVEHFLSVPASALSYEAPSEFGGDLVAFPIPEEIMNGPAYVRDLAKIFLGNIPWYEWNVERQGIAYGMARFLEYLTQLPEYQLV